MKATTKGGIILEEIKPGDIHYEYEYGMCIKSRVISRPVKTVNGEDNTTYWSWKSIHILPDGSDREEIEYGVTENMSHYGPNVYNYEAYSECQMI